METLVLTNKIEFKPFFKNNQLLIRDILDLTSTSYDSNAKLIEREVEHNRDIYIIRDASEQLLAFFMVNPEKVGAEDTYYLGLSGCSEAFKGKGLVKSLYLQLLEDCFIEEQKLGKKILLWWTTATPIVYYWFNKHIKGVQPDMEGSYDVNGREIAEKILAEKFAGAIADPQHPFILRGVATQTNYSEQEVIRIAGASKTLNIEVFENFKINEKAGDRFLMIGYAPGSLGD